MNNENAANKPELPEGELTDVVGGSGTALPRPGVPDLQVPDQSPKRCALCGYLAMGPDDYRSHMRNVHGRE